LLKTVTIISMRNVNEAHRVHVSCGQLAQDKCH
jgi:hypothetical protein